ncbi:hypothetical protein AB595_02985 [Massilia sp. WF1]|nr:hypothetical protein AB595_02985 [Massilia sp. WF1]
MTRFLLSSIIPALLLASAAGSASAANGKDLYVSPSGKDSNPGTQAAPLLTIARADALAGPGYTIHVAPGTYKVAAPSLGSVGIRTSRSGTASARIKFVSEVKRGAKIVVSGTGITWNSKGNYVDIDGFDISGSGRHGILADGSNLTITNNFIHDLSISGGCNGSGGAAIDTNGGAGGVLISGNIVRNIGYSLIGKCNTVQGIYIANPNNTVTNNIVSGVAAVGIQQWHGATASTIVNNTVFHNKEGILIGQGDAGALPGGSANNLVANNIVHDNTTYGIIEAGKVGSNNRYINNLVYSSGTNVKMMKGAVSGTITADPKFVKYAANGSGDYHLQSTSPAIGKGTTSYTLASDIDGASRLGGKVDLGAYQYTAGAPAPAPSPEPTPTPSPEPSPATGRTLYVASNGSDSNPGTEAQPFATIGRADAAATAGDTVSVAPGTYTVSAPNDTAAGIVTAKSGTAAAHIKFVSQVKWGAKIVVNGSGTAWNSKGNYVDIAGFDITGSGRIGLFASGAHTAITGNAIHDLTISGGCNGKVGAAIQVDGSVGQADIANNVVRNIGVSMLGSCNSVQGIYIASTGTLVRNNIVSGVAAVGIQQWQDATNSKIVNNTVFHAKIGVLIGDGDAGALPRGSENNIVANNLIYDTVTYGIVEGGTVGSNNRYVNNLVYASGTGIRAAGSVSGTIAANPQFKSYKADGSGDYHLLNGSPALNKGSAAYAPPTDFDGSVRDATPNIGAY